MHLVGFTIEIYYDTPSYKRQIYRVIVYTDAVNFSACPPIPTNRLFMSDVEVIRVVTDSLLRE